MSTDLPSDNGPDNARSPDPSERVSVWGAFGWAEEYLPDEMAPPVARDLIARLVRGELDGDQEAGVRENIALFRPWRRAYADLLAGLMGQGEVDRAGPSVDLPENGRRNDDAGRP